VVEGVIVDIILSALVIEVDLLLAVELTVALMLNLGSEDLTEDILVLVNGNLEANRGNFDIFFGLNDDIRGLLVFEIPAPVSVVAA